MVDETDHVIKNRLTQRTWHFLSKKRRKIAIYNESRVNTKAYKIYNFISFSLLI